MGNFGQPPAQIQPAIDSQLLTGPGQDLVGKLLMQLSAVAGFVTIFGPYKSKNDQQRWADYQRLDWSVRMLPAINVFPAATEDKTSDNAWLNGTLTLQIMWPPSFRRGDMQRIETAFKAALQNFFASKFASDMMDELYWIVRPMKVAGLNELGKTMTWTPNVEGLVENELVPVTMVDVRYRIDLRSWYRALEFDDRTKDDPFERTLNDLTTLFNEYDGTKDKNAGDVKVAVEQQVTVANP